MKIHNIIKGLAIACLLLPVLQAKPQKAVSFDLAGIRNIRHQLNGLNVSAFYHFNEHLVGGIEMNRFFTATHIKEGEIQKLSAWDFDLNFHYLLPVTKKMMLYPLSGISHTSEKEFIPEKDEILYDRFWSFNTGAGVLFELGKWGPHAEYMFTWGHMNQQFLLVGISYELEWGRTEKEKK